jgi:tetratricopeptide (TPR) repeat protein
VGRGDGLVLSTSAAQAPEAGSGSPLAAAVAAHRQAALAVAEACYHAALGDPAFVAAAWNGLAVLHEQREERDAADAAWQHALEVPRAAAVHNRALARIRQGDLASARALLGAHGALASESAPLLFLVGYAALLDGDPALARLSLEQALEREPEMARAHFTLGLALERLGHSGEALAATRRALLISPWYLPQAWVLEPHPGAAAVELPITEHDASPASGDQVLLTLGRSLLEAGHLGEALAVFDQVLLRHPAHTVALFHRGVVLAKLRRYHEALDDWARVREAEPDGTLARTSSRHAESARRLAELFRLP